MLTTIALSLFSLCGIILSGASHYACDEGQIRTPDGCKVIRGISNGN